MRLLVGLGNPGARYERTRHNIGFMAADEIVRRHGLPPFRAKFQGEVTEGLIGGVKTLVLKPQTFMNLSGNSVVAAAHFYKIEPKEIAVFHDELDLAPGKLKMKQGGGAAGHNGLRSIDAALGQNYWRIRLGIGHPGARELVLTYVLQNFAGEEQSSWLPALIDAVAEATPLLVTDDTAGFMSKVSTILNPRPPKPPREAPKPEN